MGLFVFHQICLLWLKMLMVSFCLHFTIPIAIKYLSLLQLLELSSATDSSVLMLFLINLLAGFKQIIYYLQKVANNFSKAEWQNLFSFLSI